MMNPQDRKLAILQAKSEVLQQPVYLDTETTGLDNGAEIVDICVLDHDGSVLVDSLVKPKGKIPLDVIRIHGITNEMVQDAPTWLELWPQVKAALAGRRVAIYNAEFDVRMMQQSHRKHKLRWDLDATFFCVMQLYAQFYGEWNYSYHSYRWQKLENAGRQCRIKLPNAHRAQADALLARGVLRYVAERTR